MEYNMYIYIASQQFCQRYCSQWKSLQLDFEKTIWWNTVDIYIWCHHYSIVYNDATKINIMYNTVNSYVIGLV